MAALVTRTEPGRPAATGSAPAVVSWLLEAAESTGDGTVERTDEPISFTWRWPDGSAVCLTIALTDAATAREGEARQRKVDERLAKLAGLDPLLQTMVGDLARGATHRQLADWYGFRQTTASYYVRVLRFRLGLEGMTPLQSRLELCRYARYLPALCDR